MLQEHEYALLGGVNRAKIGRYLGITAAAISSVIVLALLTIVDVANALGWYTNVPPVVLSWVSAGAVYAILYWLFDRHIWKFSFVAAALRVPDLSGCWHCKGRTINSDKTPGDAWEGDVVIIQSWDRLRVRLKTPQSASNSISAALVYDEADGFRLFYNYRNEPSISELKLTSHRGFAEFLFSKDLKSATGEYFNGYGRFTFGTMHLTRNND
ncbi:hypothetical protein [Ancylobacter sp. TS-1]|uniref:Cap15 family cyclic dinucleotide receptor domain-containing protein n=1 Tax=Ancylobacter sp. TS-1 TaxID=1850374 RepID=UPI001265C309|nr:hypothetical protein [Ancylobacter sp. TS-1]QFR33987.1 hypothetical protein GBB76_13165 [Ancylobacter sp. TS-1]